MSTERFLHRTVGGLSSENLTSSGMFHQKGQHVIGYRLLTPSSGNTIILNVNPSVTLLIPSGTLANLTLTFPTAIMDGQEITVGTSQAITTLTINSASFIANSSPPSGLSAGQVFRYIYVQSLGKWMKLN